MPAAFGLVSFLLHEGFDRNRIRKHLFVFAMAAPVLAVVTYIVLSQVRPVLISYLYDTYSVNVTRYIYSETSQNPTLRKPALPEYQPVF
jgi:hypothetical protein